MFGEGGVGRPVAAVHRDSGTITAFSLCFPASQAIPQQRPWQGDRWLTPPSAATCYMICRSSPPHPPPLASTRLGGLLPSSSAPVSRAPSTGPKHNTTRLQDARSERSAL